MAKTRIPLLFLFVFGCAFAGAQTNRYVVFFKDKNGSSYSINNPQAFLSERAIARRTKNDVQITEQDFPVNTAYITNLKNAGATVHYSSRWFNAALVQCDASLVATLGALPFVNSIEYVAPGTLSGARMPVSLTAFRPNLSSNRTKTTTQLSMIGLVEMHALNIKGEGVKVAVLDAGFPGVNTATGFAHLQDNIVDAYNFVNNQTNVYVNDDHGTEVLSVMGGYIEGVFTGGVYNADYCLYITEDAPTEYRIEEYNWLFAAERADSAGVDVINGSLGYNTFDNSSMNYTKAELDGETAVVTRAAQLAAERGILVVVSAGNEGNNAWRTVTPPADARDVLAAGSVTSSLARSPFSSVGNTTDKRIKPDLVAMGTGTFVIRANGNTGTASGTSLASPLLASLVTGLVQRFNTEPKHKIIKALTFTASQSENPDSLLGYGIPSFTAASEFLELATGVEKPSRANFSVFPNPVDSGEVYVQAKEISGQQYSIELLDAQGKRVRDLLFTPITTADKAVIDLSTIAPGLFIIRITTDGQPEIFRMVKSR